MFDYTKAALGKIIDDFKKLFFGFNVVTQCVYIAYLAYAVVTKTGYFKLNISLLAASVVYFVIYLATRGGGKTAAAVSKTAKRSLKWYKIITKAGTLAVAVYGVYETATSVTPISVLLVALMLVGWILQVLFELVLYFLENKLDYVITGLKNDWDESTGLGRVAGNLVFNKVLGWEMEESETPTKKSEVLATLVKEAKAEKLRLKKEARERKKTSKKLKGGSKPETPVIEEKPKKSNETDETEVTEVKEKRKKKKRADRDEAETEEKTKKKRKAKSSDEEA